MLVTTTGQVLGLLGVAIIGLLVSRAIKLEATLACLLCGFLAGIGVEYFGVDTGLRAHHLRELVFFIILPVLIFEAAWHLKPVLLKRWLMPALLLATVGVLVSCIVNAVLLYLGVGHVEGFPWIAALLTGAILAATDPIAVVSQLRAQNAPEDLRTLFEGESLFNDATAVVLFTVFIGIALEPGGEGQGGFLSYFIVVFFGGLAVGMICGLVSSIVALLLSNSPATMLVLVFTAFGSFYVAEHLLHVSGIMAVMAAALVVRWSLSEVENTLAAGVGQTWDWLGLLFNSLLFVIMGLVVTVDMFREQWLAMLIAVAAALVARACAVGVCGLLTYPLHNNIGLGWQILLFWGGLRGAIAIALVLSLPVELPYWYTIQSMVFGVVLFGLLVQGTTNKFLIARFGIK
jgi:CPA1 family monovalent cation:H+ antiporter